ncbi:11145_t:CDS:2 [Acaulospora morrowiae]|uniref:11145_t:CDS:1 n=1 Tax=Acaulospora morrowiae TaxID=94023 RepID=A0A9N9F9S8_9GLOM|nr:11145_t:CDS:2 [Acaulospora morrowiae]
MTPHSINAQPSLSGEDNKEDSDPVLSWEDVKKIIESGRLELFKRKKADILKYRAWKAEVAKEYDSPDNYIRKVILKWDNDEISTSKYFTYDPSNKSDHLLRLNDFPYTRIDPSITHYVLWSKFPFDPNSSEEIERFSEATFNSDIDNVEGNTNGVKKKEWLFFINPSTLQSIKSVTHAHILVRDAVDSEP